MHRTADTDEHHWRNAYLVKYGACAFPPSASVTERQHDLSWRDLLCLREPSGRYPLLPVDQFLLDERFQPAACVALLDDEYCRLLAGAISIATFREACFRCVHFYCARAGDLCASHLCAAIAFHFHQRPTFSEQDLLGFADAAVPVGALSRGVTHEQLLAPPRHSCVPDFLVAMPVTHPLFFPLCLHNAYRSVSVLRSDGGATPSAAGSASALRCTASGLARRFAAIVDGIVRAGGGFVATTSESGTSANAAAAADAPTESLPPTLARAALEAVASLYDVHASVCSSAERDILSCIAFFAGTRAKALRTQRPQVWTGALRDALAGQRNADAAPRAAVFSVTDVSERDSPLDVLLNTALIQRTLLLCGVVDDTLRRLAVPAPVSPAKQHEFAWCVATLRSVMRSLLLQGDVRWCRRMSISSPSQPPTAPSAVPTTLAQPQFAAAVQATCSLVVGCNWSNTGVAAFCDNACRSMAAVESSTTIAWHELAAAGLSAQSARAWFTAMSLVICSGRFGAAVHRAPAVAPLPVEASPAAMAPFLASVTAKLCEPGWSARLDAARRAFDAEAGCADELLRTLAREAQSGAAIRDAAVVSRDSKVAASKRSRAISDFRASLKKKKVS